MHLVIFGWGNVSRGDDGVGPLLLARIAGAGWDDAALIEDFQLQIEHALDLQDADLALFIDAGKDTPAPFSFGEIFPQDGATHTTHALSPQSVLAVYRKVTGKTPPPAFLLCVRGENFGLGEGLSAEGAARLEAAWEFLEHLTQPLTPDGCRAMRSPPAAQKA